MQKEVKEGKREATGVNESQRASTGVNRCTEVGWSKEDAIGVNQTLIRINSNQTAASSRSQHESTWVNKSRSTQKIQHKDISSR